MQDYGTGLSVQSAKNAVKRLTEKNVVIKIRRKDESGQDKSPNYSLNIIEIPFKKNKDTFIGFTIPNYTLVPDEVFDFLLSLLSGSEIKTLLYITRRTFGYSKESENISLKRMLKGYIDKDRNIIDNGVGLTKPSLLKTLRSLSKNKIIIKEKQFSKERGDEPTNYRLNFKIEHWSKNYPHRGKKNYISRGWKNTPTI